MARGIVTTLLSWWALRMAGVPLARAREIPLLILRGLLGFGALSCFLFAVVRLPLADTTVIHFTNPVFTALLATFFLGEVLGRREVALVLLALLGVVFIARPPFLFAGAPVADPLAAGVALMGAVLSAGAYVSVRRLTRTNHPLIIVFAFSLVTVVGAAPGTAAAFVLPQGVEWFLLLGVGAATQGGQVFVTQALKTEKAGRAMAVGYLQIVLAALWGLLFFREVPDGWTLFGATVIIASTFLLSRIHPVATPAGR